MLSLRRYVGFMLISLLPCIIYGQWFKISTENLPDILVLHNNYAKVRFILTNTTGMPIKVVNAKIKVPSDFQSSGWSNDCNGVTLSPGGSCNLIKPIDYLPVTKGNVNWQFTVNNGIDTYNRKIERPVVLPERGLIETLTQGLPKYSAVGKKYPLVFTFTNTSNIAVSGITVDLPKITGLSLMNTCDNTLAAGATCNVEGEYNVPNLPQQAVSFTVNFQQGGNNYPLTVHTTIAEIAIVGILQAPLPKNLPPGDDYTFILGYSNESSNYTATGVYVSFPEAPGLSIISNGCGNSKAPITLGPNAICGIMLNYNVPDNATGLHSFTTTLFSEQGANVPLTTSTTIADAAIDGQVQTPLPKNVRPGNSYLFILKYINDSNGTATGTYVSLPAAPGLSITSNTCGTPAASITLKPAATCVVSAVYRVPDDATGLHSFTTTLSYDQGANVLLTSSTTIADATIVGKMMVPLPPHVPPGSSTNIIFNYTNDSSGTATGVYVSLPEAPGLSLDNNTCGTQAAPIMLKPHTSCGVMMKYNAPDNATGLHSFTTTLSYDQGANVPLTTSTTIKDVAIVGKVMTPLSTNITPEKKRSSFSLNYRNNSRRLATGVYVSLPEVPGLSIASNTCGARTAPITLVPDASCRLTATYKTPSGATGVHNFTTTLSYDQGANVPVTISTTITKIAINGTVMAALPKNLLPGSSDYFIFAYTNDSSGTATGVYLNLPGVPGLSITSNTCGTPVAPITLAPHKSCGIMLKYDVPDDATGLHSFTTTLSYDQGASVPLTTSTTIADAIINGQVQTPLPKHMSPGSNSQFILFYKNNSDNPATGVYISLPTVPGLSITSNTCGTLVAPIVLAPYKGCGVMMKYNAPDNATGLHSFTTTLSYDQGANVPPHN